MSPRPFRIAALGAVLAVSIHSSAWARGDDVPLPAVVREVDIEEHLGQALDPNLRLTDSSGKSVRLGDYLGSGKPAILTLAYFRCPMLCGLVLAGLARGLQDVPFQPGEDYRLLTVSFDPNDRPDEAAAKERNALAAFRSRADGAVWPFLVGGTREIHALADALGFRFAVDSKTGQYAHPAAAFVLTPDGRISRYLYGTEFSPRDLRLALVEAGSGKIGTIVDRLVLTCYRFDPATRRFGPFIRGFMRIGAAFILAAVTATVALLFRAERRRARPTQAAR